MIELGEFLKSERVSRGLSPAGLAARAGLSTAVVKSLEEGQLDWIGTPMLIRGFIRNYCTALDIDPGPVIEKHSNAIESYDSQEKGIQRYKMWKLTSRGRRRWGIVSLALLGVLVVAAFYAAMWFSGRQGRLAGSPQVGKEAYPQEELPSDLPKRAVSTPSTVVEKTDSASNLPRSQETVRARPEATPREPVRVDAGAGVAAGPAGQVNREEGRVPGISPTAQEHVLAVEAPEGTWIRVKVDGKPRKGTYLQAGKKQTWKVEKSVQIEMGHVPGVRMTWDDRSVQLPEKTGKVLRLGLPDLRYLPGE